MAGITIGTPEDFEGYRHETVTDARKNIADLVNVVAYQGERIVLTRGGRPLAVLVPVSDLGELNDIDAQDMAVVRDRANEPSIPFEPNPAPRSKKKGVIHTSPTAMSARKKPTTAKRAKAARR